MSEQTEAERWRREAIRAQQDAAHFIARLQKAEAESNRLGKLLKAHAKVIEIQDKKIKRLSAKTGGSNV